MPIVGLTDEQADAGIGLPRIAKLFKGDEKPESGKRPGADLDYFRIEFEEQFEYLREQWEELFGDEPREFPQVYLTMPTVEEAFPTWLEKWNASGTLLCRGDGEHRVRWWDEDTKIYVTAKMPCTCDPQNRECKQVGRLNLIIPEFVEMTGVLGFISVSTTSINDIITIHRYLSAVQQMYGKLTGVPFVFGRAPRPITRPQVDGGKPNGKRVKMTKSLLYLHVTPTFTQNALLPILSGAMERPVAALPGGNETPAITDLETARQLLGTGGPRRVGGNGGSQPDIVEDVEVHVIQPAEESPEEESQEEESQEEESQAETIIPAGAKINWMIIHQQVVNSWYKNDHARTGSFTKMQKSGVFDGVTDTNAAIRIVLLRRAETDYTLAENDVTAALEQAGLDLGKINTVEGWAAAWEAIKTYDGKAGSKPAKSKGKNPFGKETPNAD